MAMERRGTRPDELSYADRRAQIILAQVSDAARNCFYVRFRLPASDSRQLQSQARCFSWGPEWRDRVDAVDGGASRPVGRDGGGARVEEGLAPGGPTA